MALFGFSMGGEVARYIRRHGASKLSKAGLMSAAPSLMLQTPNNPGAKVSQGTLFSETDFTADLEKFRLPTPFIHGDDDQVVPIGAAGLASAKIVKNATLKVCPVAPHGPTITENDKVKADLLAFLQA